MPSNLTMYETQELQGGKKDSRFSKLPACYRRQFLCWRSGEHFRASAGYSAPWWRFLASLSLHVFILLNWFCSMKTTPKIHRVGNIPKKKKVTPLTPCPNPDLNITSCLWDYVRRRENLKAAYSHRRPYPAGVQLFYHYRCGVCLENADGKVKRMICTVSLKI